MSYLKVVEKYKQHVMKELATSVYAVNWTIHSNVNIKPNSGTVVISYDNSNIQPLVIENFAMPLMTYYKEVYNKCHN